MTIADGALHEARPLVFASGVADIMPKVEGTVDRWVKGVFDCPYCHGYELEQGGIGVIATGPMSLHQALLLPEWGEGTLLTNGTFTPDGDRRAELSAGGVTIEEEPIVSLEGHANVPLTNGYLLPFAGIVTAPRAIPATPLAEGLGCALEETPLGLQIRTDATKGTSVSGAFACGDVARVPHSLSLAVGDGAWAGGLVHRSLVF